MAITPKLKEVRVGSVVRVDADFGRSDPVAAVVTGREKNIKNGFPGIDFHLVDNPNDNRWAYMHQVVRVVKF